MTVLAFKIFLTFMVVGWTLDHVASQSGRFSTLVATLGIICAVGAALSGFAWVMLFIWLPW
jgi:hypothetical protein